MEKSAITWSVEHLEKIFTEINFPEYQREPTVWSLDAKRRLVDSILRKFDMGSIYIYEDTYGAMDCVDGRQRLGAIMSFLGRNPKDRDDKFDFRILNEVYEDTDHPLRSMDNRTFGEIQELAVENEIAENFVRQFKEYGLTVVFLSQSVAEMEFNLQFTRLNLGTIINSGEKLHAMVGALRDKCFDELGKHAFLTETNVPTRRYSREQLAAQIIAQVFALELSRQAGQKEFTRARHFDIQRLFKKYITVGEEELKWIGKVKLVMDFLQPAFARSKALRNRAIVVSTVLLAYEQNVESSQEAETVAGFVDEFVRCLKWQIGKSFNLDEEYRHLVDFQRNVTQGSVEKPAVEARAKVFEEGLALWRSNGTVRGDNEFKENHPGHDPIEERATV